jgi:FlaA1/EpsC-like NDP-sugar epimerase
MKTVNINHSRVLITGGTGSWGHELVKQLLEKYSDVKEIRIYSRGEHRQVEMRQEFKFNKKLKFIIGDVRDKNILHYAMKDIDIVFHLAALKHVPVCEENTWEAVLTNINGTQNVIEAAINNKVKKVIDVSTDKAVDPFNFYGVTKSAGEKLMINANFNYPYQKKDMPSFICIRAGNVIGTNGSVIPLFKKQLMENNEITVTDCTMTRFLMSTRQAIGLIFTATENSIGGELFVMRMPGTTVNVIAKVMIKLFGNSNSKVREIGRRPGEKQHEVLVSKNESPFTHALSNDYFVILPQEKYNLFESIYKKYPRIDHEEFSSFNTDQLTSKAFEEILLKEKWLFNENQENPEEEQLSFNTNRLTVDIYEKYLLRQKWLQNKNKHYLENGFKNE